MGGGRRHGRDNTSNKEMNTQCLFRDTAQQMLSYPVRQSCLLPRKKENKSRENPVILVHISRI